LFSALSESPVVAIDIQQQFSDLPRIVQGRAVLNLRRLEQPAQVGRDVADVVAETNCVPEHFAAALLGAAGGFEEAPGFDLLQLDQQLGTGDLPDWFVAESWEDEGLQHPFGFFVGLDRAFAPADFAGEGGKVVPADLFEGRFARESQGLLLRLAFGARIFPIRQQATGSIAPVTSHR
jgi:hypothetical protein